MLARHANELMLRLEQVRETGASQITSYQLVLWYGQERLTKNIWRDIDDKWKEVSETHRAPLLAGEIAGGWCLIWGEGLTTNDYWLKDVRKLGGRPVSDLTLEDDD